MDLHYREQVFVLKNTSFNVEQKNRRFNENDICDGEKGCLFLILSQCLNVPLGVRIERNFEQ